MKFNGDYYKLENAMQYSNILYFKNNPNLTH